ncbi:MAG: acyl-CoA dehydrogenase family protein [Actinomycetota bacterium]
MDFALPASNDPRRIEVRDWLGRHRAPTPVELARAGYVAPGWPREPDAGSDLAGLATSAVLDGDEWVVNGQKVWTSSATEADFGILLAWTDPSAPKHRGISYLLCPMRQPGIEIRPIREMTGRSHFNEVFLVDARIPNRNLLGQPHHGWTLAKVTLGNERVSLSSGGVLWGMGPTTSEVLDGLPRPLDGVNRDRAAGLFIDSEVIRILGLRILSRLMSGGTPGPESAVKKMLADRHGQNVMDLVRDLGAAGGMLDGDESSWGYLFSRALTIGGGTAEVLHNVIGEQILGLPKDLEPSNPTS